VSGIDPERVWFGDVDAARELVERFHYSARMPAGNQLVATYHATGGLFGDRGPAVAAAVFRPPGARWSEDVIELARLVRRDDSAIQLTSFLSTCCGELRSRGFDLIVSMADGAHGHHGGIYQAASWSFAGRRAPRIDGIWMGDKFIPTRSANNLFGTSSIAKLRKMFPSVVIEPNRESGKWLFWKALSKNGQRKAKRLGLRALVYEKPTRDA
jgi:hypothetical protein